MGRVVVQHAQRLADDRVGVRPVPRRSLGIGAGEPGPDRGDDEQVEQPVEDHLLAGLVLDDLVGEERDQWTVPRVAREGQQRRQCSEQALADGRGALVGAGEHHRRSGEVVPPRPDPEIHRLRQIGAVERRAVLTRVDHDLGRGVRVIGDGVRIGAAHHGDVARAEQHRITVRRDDPRVAAHHRHQRQRCAVLDPDRPWRLHDRPQQERSVSPGSVEQAGDRIHRPEYRR